MAILIGIRKIEDSPSEVKYAFAKDLRWDDPDCCGVLLLNKQTGEPAIVVEPRERSMWIIERVIFKLHQHWQSREFPENTSWAA